MAPKLEEQAGFVELVLPAKASYVALARTLLQDTARHSGFNGDQAAEMAVALSEAFTNVITHARTPWVTIRYAVAPLGITIEVRDDGEGFDTAVLEHPYDPVAESGRGMHLIRSLMDAVECQSSSAGTVVRMTRLKEVPQREGASWRVVGKPFRTIGHIRQTIDRYRRDLGLMLGEIDPTEGDLDDIAILEQYHAADDKEAEISDRKLRIKTLEATLEILREEL
ncbi:MAG: ATP-binding protein [bacterium]